jgi:LPS export ABC transporter protein LptC
MSVLARPLFRIRAFEIVGLGIVGIALTLAPARGAPPAAVNTTASPPSASTVLRFTGLTFVGSRGDGGELVLRSIRGVFRPATEIAHLEDVTAVFSENEEGDGFTLSCDRAELNLESHDFEAEGNVVGVTGKGQRYATERAVYTHASGLLHSAAPVTMSDDMGTFRGDGFRYDVREGKFKLLGNVSVEQAP